MNERERQRRNRRLAWLLGALSLAVMFIYAGVMLGLSKTR